MDSQNKCESWLKDIENVNYNQEASEMSNSENQLNNEGQFYLTRDEEEDPDQEIVPYFPESQLSPSKIIPKEEEEE